MKWKVFFSLSGGEDFFHVVLTARTPTASEYSKGGGGRSEHLVSVANQMGFSWENFSVKGSHFFVLFVV